MQEYLSIEPPPYLLNKEKNLQRRRQRNSHSLCLNTTSVSDEIRAYQISRKRQPPSSSTNSRRGSSDSEKLLDSRFDCHQISPPYLIENCGSKVRFLWRKEDTEYYSHLADMHREKVRDYLSQQQFADADPAEIPDEDNFTRPINSLFGCISNQLDQETFRMRLPRAKCLRSSHFIPQSELVPLEGELAAELAEDFDATTDGGCDELDTEEPTEAKHHRGHDLNEEQIALAQEILLDHFHESHRCDHVFQTMAFHPGYLKVFLEFHNLLLQGPGPIGSAERHYLAIMSASRHRCFYLVQLHAQEFILAGGDPNWLQGLSQSSAKIQKLAPLCKIIAHRPWEVTSEFLKGLLSGPDSFSQSELVHALALISHFVSFSGFVAGTGIAPEIDFTDGHAFGTNSGENSGNQQLNGTVLPAPSPTPSSPGLISGEQVLEIMKNMEDIEQKCNPALSEDLLLERFRFLEEENARISACSQQEVDDEQSRYLAEVLNFVIEPDFAYVDFVKAKADGGWRSFRAQDYDWEEQGRCMADRFLPDLGSRLDARFQSSSTLTYGTLGSNRGVNTTPFRRSIWYYIHSIYGVRHDDYDYAVVNKLLSMELKTYCKTVACFPDRVTIEDYKKAMPYLKHSEKVHVNLVIMDARLQATLLYGLRALNNHLNMTDCDF